jgi:hypothetical protein
MVGGAGWRRAWTQKTPTPTTGSTTAAVAHFENFEVLPNIDELELYRLRSAAA